MATTKAFDHDRGVEPPRKQAFRCERRHALAVGENHFQYSDGMRSGPGDLPVLSLDKTRLSSSWVKGWRGIGAGSSKRGGGEGERGGGVCQTEE